MFQCSQISSEEYLSQFLRSARLYGWPERLWAVVGYTGVKDAGSVGGTVEVIEEG